MYYKIEESHLMTRTNKNGQIEIYKEIVAICPCCEKVLAVKEKVVKVLTPQQAEKMRKRNEEFFKIWMK